MSHHKYTTSRLYDARRIKPHCHKVEYKGDYCVSSADNPTVKGTYRYESTSTLNRPVWKNNEQNKYLYLVQKDPNCGKRVPLYRVFIADDTSETNALVHCSGGEGTHPKCFVNRANNWRSVSNGEVDASFKIVQCSPILADEEEFERQDFCIAKADLSKDKAIITGAYHSDPSHPSITVSTPFQQLSNIVYTSATNQWVYYIKDTSSQTHYSVIDNDKNYDNGYVAICDTGNGALVHQDSVPLMTDCAPDQWQVYDANSQQVFDESVDPEECYDRYTGTMCVSSSVAYDVEGQYEYKPDMTSQWTGPVYYNSQYSTFLYPVKTGDYFSWHIDSDLDPSAMYSYCDVIERNDVPASYLTIPSDCQKGDFIIWFENAWQSDENMRIFKCGDSQSTNFNVFEQNNSNILHLFAFITFFVFLLSFVWFTVNKKRQNNNKNKQIKFEVVQEAESENEKMID